MPCVKFVTSYEVARNVGSVGYYYRGKKQDFSGSFK